MPRSKTPAEVATGYRHTIVVDWDGTLVPSDWPNRPEEYMPGAIKFLKDALTYANVVVQSSRTNPWNPWSGSTEPLHPDDVQEEVDYIRRVLDREGFTTVGIWTKPGKPTADMYIDDKAERYNGHVHSWDKLRQKVRMRFGIANAAFPPWGEEDDE